MSKFAKRMYVMKTFFAALAVAFVLTFTGCNTGAESKCNCADDLASVTEGAPVSECSCCAACPCSHPKNAG